MEHYTLSNKELLYVTALLRMSNIWEIENEFENSSQDSVALNIVRLQDEIAEKGYTEIELDGRFRLDEDFYTLLITCKSWDHMIIFYDSEKNKGSHIDRCFIKQQKIICMLKNGSQIELTYITPAELRESVQTFFSHERKFDKKALPRSISTSAKRICEMSNLRRSRFIEELRRIGCNLHLSDLIADSMQGRAAYNSVTILKRENKAPVICKKLTTCYFDEGALIITPDKVVDHDIVQFTVWDRNSLRARVDEVYKILSIEEKSNG